MSKISMVFAAIVCARARVRVCVCVCVCKCLGPLTVKASSVCTVGVVCFGALQRTFISLHFLKY